MSETKWTAEPNSYANGEGMSGWAILYNPTPGGRKNDDGSTSYSLSVPALILPDLIEDPEITATAIAGALNRDDDPKRTAAPDLYEALKLVTDDLSEFIPAPAQRAHIGLQAARAALAKARGEG